MDNQNITLPISVLEQRFKTVAALLPPKVGNEVVNFALDNFKRQSWMGNVEQPWMTRKDPNKWKQKVKRPGRSLLVDTARLKRSIRVNYADWQTISIGSDVPYASAHNNGHRGEVHQFVRKHPRNVTIKGIVKKREGKKKTSIEWGRVYSRTTMVREHPRIIKQNMPARRFLGNSPYLTARLKRVVMADIMKALKPNF